MKKEIAEQTGYMIETVLGYLEMAKHHNIDKLNKPTGEYIDKAIEHLEVANRNLLLGSMTKRQREVYDRLNGKEQREHEY